MSTREKSLAERVDELGDLQVEAKQLLAKIADTDAARQLAVVKHQVEVLAEIVKDEMNSIFDADKPGRISGERFDADLGAAAKKRTVVDNDYVIQCLAEDDAWKEIIKFTLGNLDDYLTKKQRDRCITESRTGSRKFKVSGRVV